MRRWIFPVLVILCITIDQAGKFWAVAALENSPIPLLGGIVYLNLRANTGGAFSFLSSYPAFFTIVGTLLLICMIIFIRRITALPALYQAALGLVGGGAVGNLADRFRLGYVIDFIDLKFWPVFNLADSFITIGVFILAYLFLTEKKEEEE